jgi:hypothetical protein
LWSSLSAIPVQYEDIREDSEGEPLRSECQPLGYCMSLFLSNPIFLGTVSVGVSLD